jgi:hypothetical protein
MLHIRKAKGKDYGIFLFLICPIADINIPVCWCTYGLDLLIQLLISSLTMPIARPSSLRSQDISYSFVEED